ncbi:MAG: hypothetical protein QM756_06435 [Polyangiaceae bacterium]
MTRTSCDRSWEAEAIEDGRSGANERLAFERHAASCNVCSEAIAELRRVRALMQGLPEFELAPFAERRARGQLLSRANAELTQHRRSPVWVIAAAIGVALAGVASAAIWNSPASAPSEAPPTPSVTEPTKPKLSSRAPRLGSEPRTPIEPTIDSNPEVPLDGPSEAPEWHDPLPSARSTPAPVEKVGKRSSDASRPSLGVASAATSSASATRSAASAPVSSASSDERPSASDDFARAIGAFRHGEYAEAERLFSAFRARYPRDARAEDATFLRAVARARGGDAAGAAALASDYLRAFPAGLRRAEAERLQNAAAKKDSSHQPQ